MLPDPKPLFTRSELASAFALLVEAELAERLATEWFAIFADAERVDEAGFFLYHDWREDASNYIDLTGEPEVVSRYSDSTVVAEEEGAVWLVGGSEERMRSLLLRYSDFTLDLASLVSEDVATRVRLARQDTEERAERRREQMRAFVRSTRGKLR